MSGKALVLVEPEIPENTGFIARLCSNFGYNLRVVNPGFNLSKARKTAKNCQEKLRDARIYENVEEAVEDLEYVLGTKPGKGSALKKFDPRNNTSIMIGRESNGLNSEELKLCDSVVHIETVEYASINQSHASAILMHRMNSEEEQRGLTNDQKDLLEEKLPETLYETVLDANPSKEHIGRIIRDLK